MISASPSSNASARLRALLTLLAVVGLVLTAVAVAPTAAATTGAISGVVNGPEGPLTGVQVTAYVPHPDYAGEWNIVGTTSTDATGSYTLSGLAARSYQIEFVDPGRNYVTEYYDDVTSLNVATPVPVGTTTVTGIDATLGLPSHITGTVRDTAGAGIPSVLVTALRFDPVNGWVTDQTALTDDLGAYDVPGLSHGIHLVEFRPYGSQSGRYRLEYWDDAASKDEATDVTVAPASTVNGIDAVLASVTGAGRVLGAVTGMGGEAVSGAVVTAYSRDATTDTWVSRTRALTDAVGEYSLGGLAPGTYRVGFAYDDHAAEFWQDAGSLAEATDVVVGSSATVSGIDAQLASAPITNTSPPTVTGDAVVGGTLTATTGSWQPGTGFSYEYEWLADDEPIAGATGSQYQPGSADLGKAISVRVTASRGSEPPAGATSAPTAPVAELVVVNQTAPGITGTAQVHSTLTATDGTWTPSTGLTFAYQWLVGGVPVDGATLRTYTLRPADADQAVTVRVTASKPMHTPASATSAPTGAVALAPLTNTVAPSISGPAEVGGTLTAARGTWSPDDGLAVGYQWYVGGAPVDGATGTTYHPVEGDIGQTVTVLVSVSRAGHQPASRLSSPTSAVTMPALANTAMPTVTGTPQVGGTLTATTGEWSPSDGVVQQVEWLVGGVPVDHEGSTYSPTADDVGKAVAVRVTATRAGFAPATRTSTPTAMVYEPATNTVAPRVTGTPQVGRRLTAAPGTWSPSGLGYGYQWLVNGRPVSGQTASTFTVPPSALRRTVAVRVTAAGSGPAVTVTSAPTPAVRAGVLRLVRKPAVTGVARVGKVLRATAGSVSPAATKATFRWLRNGRAIPRATRATYKLVTADRRKRISVVVTYVRVGYTTLRATSRPTATVR